MQQRISSKINSWVNVDFVVVERDESDELVGSFSDHKMDQFLLDVDESVGGEHHRGCSAAHYSLIL